MYFIHIHAYLCIYIYIYIYTYVLKSGLGRVVCTRPVRAGGVIPTSD